MENVKKKRKLPWKIIFNVAIFGLTIFLIVFFIFSEGGLVDLIKSGQQVNLLWLVMAVFVHFLNIVLDATIIYLFLKETTPQVTFWNAFIASMTGQFFCAVTPSATGGQPMQVLAMSRMGIKGTNATSALVQKFLVWQFTLTVYCIIAVVTGIGFFAKFLDPAMIVFSIIGFGTQVFMIAVLLLASFCKPLTTKIVNAFLTFLGKIHLMKNVEKKKKSIDETLSSFHENNKELNKNKALLVKIYVITAVQMTACFLAPYCIAMSFGITGCSIFDMLRAQAYVSMVSSLVPLPGGSGAAEYCFGVFFGTYFTTETIKSAILIWRTITYYGTIAVSAPFAIFRDKKSLKSKVEDH
ncbi:MAG: flippase-like domain-containing protein [Clostridia bacterium]|nr:flippase-like domain-containing protein [Clostridia bacterium]